MGFFRFIQMLQRGFTQYERAKQQGRRAEQQDLRAEGLALERERLELQQLPGPQLTHADLMNETREIVDRMARTLPTRMSVTNLSTVATLPFKVFTCRGVLAWRFVELSRSALTAIDAELMASAVVLTRAVLETGAALWYLNEHVFAALKRPELSGLDTTVTRLLLGSKLRGPDVPKTPDAINVLNFLDALDKRVEGTRERYDFLSEAAHPNWSGAMYLYCTDDPAALTRCFGPDRPAVDDMKLCASSCLSGTSGMIELALSQLLLMLPLLNARWESQTKDASDGA